MYLTYSIVRISIYYSPLHYLNILNIIQNINVKFACIKSLDNV